MPSVVAMIEPPVVVTETSPAVAPLPVFSAWMPWVAAVTSAPLETVTAPVPWLVAWMPAPAADRISPALAVTLTAPSPSVSAKMPAWPTPEEDPEAETSPLLVMVKSPVLLIVEVYCRTEIPMPWKSVDTISPVFISAKSPWP